MRRIAAILLCLILGLISLEHLVKAGVLHVPPTAFGMDCTIWLSLPEWK